MTQRKKEQPAAQKIKMVPHAALMADNWLQKMVATTGTDFLNMLTELLNNARDAGAKSATIERYRDADGDLCLRVIDDGVGMDHRRRVAFNSLMKSDWNRRGAEVRGHCGTGRLTIFLHAPSADVQTIDADTGAYNFGTFTAELMMKMWLTGVGNWGEGARPTNLPIGNSGTAITLHKLGKGAGISERHDRSVERIVNNLAKELPIDFPGRVRVIDEDGKVHALVPRRLRGTKIEGSEDVPLIGSVSYSLGVTETVDGKEPPVTLFGISKICSLSAFFGLVGELRDPEIEAFRLPCGVILCHPLVGGIIDVPALNDFVDHDRKNVSPSVLEHRDKLLELFRFLHKHVVPRVEEAIGISADNMSSSEDQVLVDGLLRDIGALGTRTGPRSRGPKGTDAPLRVDMDDFYVLPGASVPMRVVNANPAATIAWEAVSGGEIKRTDGVSAVFVAGNQIGPGEIRVIEAVGGRQVRETTVRPRVVPEIPFEFENALRHTEPGQAVGLTLRFPNRVRGRIRWNTPPGTTLVESRGRAEPNEARMSFAADKLGTYSVEAYVEGDDDLLRVCTIVVSNRPSSDGDGPIRREIEYNGTVYEVRIQNWVVSEDSDAAFHVVTQWAGDGARVVLMVNTRSKPLLGASDAVRKGLLLSHVSSIIAENVLARRADMTNQVILPGMLRLEANKVFCALRARKKRK